MFLKNGGKSTTRDLGSIDTKAGPCYLSLQLLKDITNDFSDERELGRGGFGVVYKGLLKTGEVVAVKKLAYIPGVKDRQFENEVYHLMILKHPNIVRFLGYCFETRHMCIEHEGKLCFAEMTERLLCLEYLPNGSLRDHISDESCRLDWHERYKIIKGICHGLHYLHEKSPKNTPIIHLDLKPANILLTNEMEPKITDFGQSRLFDEEQSRTYTKSIEGTLGYMAREYLDRGMITKKADIFSLGVIIVEIITGHRDYPHNNGKSTQNFVEKVLEKWKKRLENSGCASIEKDCQQIKICIEIGLQCVQIDASQRPTAKEIIRSLNGCDSTNLQVINDEIWSLVDQIPMEKNVFSNFMSWLNKIFKGTINRISRGHYDGDRHEGHSSDYSRDTSGDSDNEAIDHGIALSLAEQDQNKGKEKAAIDTHCNSEEDYAGALQESLNVESPRQNVPAKQPPLHFYPASGFRICAGCQNSIGDGRFLSCLGSVWHPQCFRCFACNKPISEYEFAMHDNQPYHRPCYKEHFHPKCDVCDNFIATNRDGLIEYRAHPFWMQKYCPSHEDDGTPRCCSCERMEPREVKYITLDDGRKLCLECLNSSIMDTPECQHLYMDIQEFFEGLNMKVEQQIPLLLVERQALNEALEAEKNGHHLPETRGLCLSEEQIVRTILKRPQIGPGNRILGMITGPYKLSRRCEVTAILILYGLPRLQTGSILAHEMMHAYLRLKGFRNLSIEVEEGICQFLSHLWLESEIIAGSSSNVASSSAASSSSSSAPTSSKKGAKTEFEKKLGAFIKNQIETDPSEAYGGGFRAGCPAVERYGLRRTLDHIKLTGSFPY
ncbi:unnamed protein product [Urochloa humidicola]